MGAILRVEIDDVLKEADGKSKRRSGKCKWQLAYCCSDESERARDGSDSYVNLPATTVEPCAGRVCGTPLGDSVK